MEFLIPVVFFIAGAVGAAVLIALLYIEAVNYAIGGGLGW